jgi:hypothetical protein
MRKLPYGNDHSLFFHLQYYIFTYGLCGGAYLLGGSIGSAGCNVLTIPRVVDCAMNTYFNCYLTHCGLVGI